MYAEPPVWLVIMCQMTLHAFFFSSHVCKKKDEHYWAYLLQTKLGAKNGTDVKNHLSGHPVSGDSPRHPLTPAASSHAQSISPQKGPNLPNQLALCSHCSGLTVDSSWGASDWCSLVGQLRASAARLQLLLASIGDPFNPPWTSTSSIFPDTLSYWTQSTQAPNSQKNAASFGRSICWCHPFVLLALD